MSSWIYLVYGQGSFGGSAELRKVFSTFELAQQHAEYMLKTQDNGEVIIQNLKIDDIGGHEVYYKRNNEKGYWYECDSFLEESDDETIDDDTQQSFNPKIIEHIACGDESILKSEYFDDLMRIILEKHPLLKTVNGNEKYIIQKVKEGNTTLLKADYIQDVISLVSKLLTVSISSN